MDDNESLDNVYQTNAEHLMLTNQATSITTGPPPSNHYTSTTIPVNGSITIHQGTTTTAGQTWVPNTGGYGSTGTYVPNTYPTISYPSSPHQYALNFDLLRIQTPNGPIVVKQDGSVEYPTTLDEATKTFWDHVGQIAAAAILTQVRKLAAEKVKELLPELLPELDAYDKATIPNAIAVAIEGS